MKCDCLGWTYFVVAVILSPLIAPFAYLSGIAVLSSLLCRSSQGRQSRAKRE